MRLYILHEGVSYHSNTSRMEARGLFSVDHMLAAFQSASVVPPHTKHVCSSTRFWKSRASGELLLWALLTEHTKASHTEPHTLGDLCQKV